MLNEANRTATGAGNAWWIVSRVAAGRVEAMTVPRGGGKALVEDGTASPVGRERFLARLLGLPHPAGPRRAPKGP